MTVRFTHVARKELAAQLAYLAAVNAPASRRVAATVREALILLATGHLDGPRVQLRSGRQVRRWVVPPLLVFYRREGSDVRVLRVRHGAQRPLTSH